MQAGLHRARSPPDGEGDVTFAQVGVVAQHNGDPQRHGEPLEGGQHRLGHFGLLGAVVGAGALLHHGGERLVTGAAIAVGDLAPKLGVARVDDHAVEPGPDARDGRERIAEAPGPQVGVLDRFLGVGPVPENQAGRAERADVPLFEPVGQPLLHHPPP